MKVSISREPIKSEVIKRETNLELVGVGNVVVGSTEVGGSSDKVHVEVGVIVLLEIDGLHAVARVAAGGGQLADNPLSQCIIILISLLFFMNM